MDGATLAASIGAIAGVGVAAYTLISFWTNLSDRITKADADAEAAGTAASNATLALTAQRLEIDRLKNELVDHRVAVAKEYVSKDTLSSLESRVIEAINSLGQRLDNLFKQNH